MSIRQHAIRALLTCAIAAGCAGPEYESFEVQRACDAQGRCYAHAPGWVAWAQYDDNVEQAIAHGLLESPHDLGAALCYYLAVESVDARFCTIDVDGITLLGTPIADVDYATSDCAEVAYPWDYVLEGTVGGCYGAVGPLAVRLDTERPID